MIGPEEIAAVNAVLESGMLAQGPKVAELEDGFADYCGTKYAVAFNSGTAAIHAALFAIGVTAGDEVVTTPFSFIATINPILLLGAQPVLVDIEPTTFNLDIAKVEAKITGKTKAIVVVDLFGQPHNHSALKKLAKKHNIKIIEDACQAIGATHGKKKAGSLGDIGCFSLYATKNIMSGEGGVATTDNPRHVELMRQFRMHGMTAQYDYAHVGYNYRMSDLHAAIGVEQLKKADIFNSARQKNAQKLSRGLKSIDGIILPATTAINSHVYHQYTIRVTPQFPLTRDALVQYLRDHGIGASVFYPRPLHAFPHVAAYGYEVGDFPEAERASAEVVSLPVHPSVTASDLAYIVDTVKAAARVAGEAE